MGSTAVLIAIAYGLVTVVAVGVAVVIASSTIGSRPAVHPERLAHRERTWLFIVIAILLALLFATIWFTPYGRSGTNGDVVVNVDSRQFFWQIRPSRVPANRRIEFRLRSQDVNHGFGIYDARNNFIAQAQVVPGRTQKLVHTFDKPGRYKILCLEFCGFGHAAMQGGLTVTE